MGGIGGRRLAVAGLSLAGLGVAAYLTLFQAKVLRTVWDPFSSGGSAWILRRSPLVRWLGFPDAAMGVGAYAAELALESSAGGARRGAPRRKPELALGALAAAMAAGSVVLVALQAAYGRWCALCLASAAASVAIAALVAPDVRQALRAIASPKGPAHPGGRDRETARGGRVGDKH